MHRWVMLCVAAILASGCRLAQTGPGSSTWPGPNPSGWTSVIPLCESLPTIAAPEERYRDPPIYVGNEQPVGEVLAWARTKPGFEEIWIDRSHAGWITVAFSSNADVRQAELEREFPNVGAVAVGVDWTMEELRDLQSRVTRELQPLFPIASGIYVMQGVVGVDVGYLLPDRVAAVESRFAGEHLCVGGRDPSQAPQPGSQQLAGDGWRLLADERGVGQSYRTGIAAHEESYRALWSEIGLGGEPPAVDFQSEVVIWFGAVYGSSCPDLRLDDVIVDAERRMVYAQIVLVDSPPACTADANPHAYVVALARSKLPAGPFVIQLDAEDPPPGAREERTFVDVDLSQPGSVAGAGQIHPDTSTPEPFVLEPDSIMEPGVEFPFVMSVACGVEWIGPFNDLSWRADVPAGEAGYVPPEWRALVKADATLDVRLLLETGPPPRIIASANEHEVLYEPTTATMPTCD
jgi:hypothetical protein